MITYKNDIPGFHRTSVKLLRESWHGNDDHLQSSSKQAKHDKRRKQKQKIGVYKNNLVNKLAQQCCILVVKRSQVRIIKMIKLNVWKNSYYTKKTMQLGTDFIVLICFQNNYPVNKNRKEKIKNLLVWLKLTRWWCTFLWGQVIHNWFW